MIAVVETEFTEGWLHIVSYSCVSPKDGSLKRTEHAAKKHHWAQNCTFPVCTISTSRAVQTAQSTPCFSLCPFMSYYAGKWALSSDWREARLQEGSRKPQCHSAARAEGPDGGGRTHSQGTRWCEAGCEQEGLVPELQYSILTCHMAQHFLINRGHFSLGTAAYVQHWIIRSTKFQQSRTHPAL